MTSHPETTTEQQGADAPASPGVSSTGIAWIAGFFFSFRLFIMLLSVRVLGTDEQTGVEIGLVAGFLLLAVATLLSIGQHQSKQLGAWSMPSVRWVVFFLGFSGCSLAWTAAASLSAAAVYWLAMACDVVTVSLLLQTGEIRDSLTAFIKGYVYGACAVAIIAWMLPAQSDLRLGDEELLGPNQIGYLCAFALFFVQYLMRSTRQKWGIEALVLALTLFRSLSKTSIIAFLAGEAFILLRDRSIQRRTKVMLMLATVATVIGFAGLLSSYFEIYTTVGNSPETLTGRIGIWGFILNEAVQRPWIGHGFHSVWKVIPAFGPFEARHAHNEWLQQFYAYGAVGIVMLIGVYGSYFRQIRKYTAGSIKTLHYGMLIFVLVRGLTDTEPFDLSLPIWTIFMFSVLMAQERAASAELIDTRLERLRSSSELNPSIVLQ